MRNEEQILEQEPTEQISDGLPETAPANAYEAAAGVQCTEPCAQIPAGDAAVTLLSAETLPDTAQLPAPARTSQNAVLFTILAAVCGLTAVYRSDQRDILFSVCIWGAAVLGESAAGLWLSLLLRAVTGRDRSRTIVPAVTCVMLAASGIYALVLLNTGSSLRKAYLFVIYVVLPFLTALILQLAAVRVGRRISHPET